MPGSSFLTMVIQPSASEESFGKIPEPYGDSRQAEGGARMPDGQPGEVAQFDHPGSDRILDGEPGEGFVQGEQLLVRNIGRGRNVGQLDPTAVTAMLSGPLPARSIHQDAAHGFRGGREEVAAA